MMKKAIAIILGIVMLLGLCSCANTTKDSTEQDTDMQQETNSTSTTQQGNTSVSYVNKDTWPIVNEPITIELMGPKAATHIDWKDMDLFKWLTEKTNINFEFNTPSSESFQEKKNLAFASGNLPDMIIGGSFTSPEIVRYGVQQELLVRFEDYKEYAPNIFKAYSDYPDIYASQLADNGYSYSSGYILNTFWLPTDRNLFVNKAWMNKVGKSTPTTVNEYVELLRAFKASGDLNENGQDDEIVLGGSGSYLPALRSSILSAFGLLTDTFEIERGTGEIIYSPITDSFKEYLKIMNIFWEEGILDIDIFSQTSTEYKAKAAQGRYGSFASNSALMTTQDHILDYEMLTPLTSEINSEPLSYINGCFTPGQGVITTTNPYPEATMRLFDWMYTKEGMLSMNYGPNNWIILDNGAHAFVLADGSTGVDHEYRSTLTIGYGVGIPMNARASEESFRAYCSDTENNYLNSITYSQVIEHALPYTHTPTPSVIMTEDETESTIAINDLKKYVAQMEAKFITGELDIDASWDSYVNTCKSMNLDQIYDAYKSAYGRYLNNVKSNSK